MAFIDPAQVVPLFGLKPDMVVADFGCATGTYAMLLSRAVLPNGKVYAVDVQRDLLVALKSKFQDEHIGNVELLWGDLDKVGGSKIADRVVDFVLASNILFQMEDKGYTLALEAKRVLKPDGRAVVIDWLDSFGNMGPHADQIVTKDMAQKAFTAAGFEVEREFVPGEHHYGLIMKKR